MIKEVKMFTIICDNCKHDIGEDQDYSCWSHSSSALDNANESDWLEHEHNHYCPSCYSYNDNDELIIDSSRTNKEKQ
jgi:hypothetical protein